MLHEFKHEFHEETMHTFQQGGWFSSLCIKLLGYVAGVIVMCGLQTSATCPVVWFQGQRAHCIVQGHLDDDPAWVIGSVPVFPGAGYDSLKSRVLKSKAS